MSVKRFTYLRPKTKFEMMYVVVKLVVTPFMFLTDSMMKWTLHKKHGFSILLFNFLWTVALLFIVIWLLLDIFVKI